MANDSDDKITLLDAKVTIDGQAIPPDEVFDFVVEADLDHPDMASVVFSNAEAKWSDKAKVGAAIEIDAGLVGARDAVKIFNGEVIGIEPLYDAGQPLRLTLRALNKLHRLSRGKKSATFMKMSDADVVNKIAQSYSLSAQFGSKSPSSPVYEHLYQHNQTDLEFLRHRAARIGYEVLVEDTKLHFRPKSNQTSDIKLSFGSNLERFHPRLSATNQVTKVTVRGWDWNKKDKIVGEATSSTARLGSNLGGDMAKKAFEKAEFIDVDVPIATVQEAKELAQSILDNRAMSFITGDAECVAEPKLKPGMVIEVKLGDPRFEGKYYVTAVRHQYTHGGKNHGFRTEFRFARDGIDK